MVLWIKYFVTLRFQLQSVALQSCASAPTALVSILIVLRCARLMDAATHRDSVTCLLTRLSPHHLIHDLRIRTKLPKQLLHVRNNKLPHALTLIYVL